MLRKLFAAFLFIAGSTSLVIAADPADRPQWRAVWVDAFNPGIKTPQQVDQLIAEVKALNCNTIVAQVRKRGDALFRKRIEPFTQDASIPDGFDPLADVLEKAHKAGIQVHAWVNVNTVWPNSGGPPKDTNHIFNKHGPDATGHDAWLTKDDKGNFKFESGYFTDPGHPDYQDHFVKVVSTMAKEYPVDGVHLDFVRYTETEGSNEQGYGAGYNQTNVERFQKATGATEQPKRNDPKWQQWRRDQVTGLVRQLRTKLLEQTPNVMLSGSMIPWGDGPLNEDAWKHSAPYNRVFQDWHSWRKEGLIDIIFPMNYDREARPDQKKFFEHWVKFETQYKYKAKTVVGIGAYMNSVEDGVAQTRFALANDADGVCYFSYNHIKKNLDDYRKALVEKPGPKGDAPPFAKQAELPKVPRIEKPVQGAYQGVSDAEDAPIPANHDHKRLITAEDLWKVKRLGPPSLSPDGKWCVSEVTTWDIAKDESASELWLFATEGSSQRQLTASGGKNSAPQWSPDGKLIAFTSKRSGDEVAQVYLISPDGGEARRFSKMPMAPSALKWAADSKTVYCIASTWPDATTDTEHTAREKKLKDTKAKAVVITDAAFRYWDHWISDGKRPYVYSIDVASGAHRNLLAGTGRNLPPYEPSAGDYDVSPDGKELCFVAENVKAIGLDANHDLYAMDLTTKSAPRNLTNDNAANDTHPVYNPDGKSLAFLRTTIKHFYADRRRLMVLDRTGGPPREVTAGKPLDRSVANPHWLPADSHNSPTLMGEVEDAGYVRLGFFSANDPARLLPGHYSDRSLDVASQKTAVAFLRSDFNRPPQLWTGDANGTKRRIDNLNNDLTSSWKLGKVEEVHYPGADGREIQMWVVYPPDFDPAKKWPLLQMVHGGPHNAITTEFSFRWNPQVWAARGWVVGIVNFHGSSGFGQEFTDSITGDVGTKPMEDIMKSTDWFNSKPWIDANRMAAAGGSYGGYMMAWLNGHTDRFKAMVCHAGVYNWHSMMASDFIKGRERSLGAPPWGDNTKVDKQNAQRFAANFKTPTLVVHGEKDYRVPVTQGLEYYNTLKQKGVPTRLLYFPDENHWVLKPQNALVWHREVFDWLERYIGKGSN